MCVNIFTNKLTTVTFYLREFSSVRHWEVVHQFSFPQVPYIQDTEEIPEMILLPLSIFDRMYADMEVLWNLNLIFPNIRNTLVNHLTCAHPFFHF